MSHLTWRSSFKVFVVKFKMLSGCPERKCILQDEVQSVYTHWRFRIHNIGNSSFRGKAKQRITHLISLPCCLFCVSLKAFLTTYFTELTKNNLFSVKFKVTFNLFRLIKIINTWYVLPSCIQEAGPTREKS